MVTHGARNLLVRAPKQWLGCRKMSEILNSKISKNSSVFRVIHKKGDNRIESSSKISEVCLQNLGNFVNLSFSSFTKFSNDT